MQVINDTDFRKQLKNGNLGSYLFYGEEDYLKAHALSLAEKNISPDPTFALFNVAKIDALDYSPNKLIDAVMQPPMMATQKLIALTGFDFTSMKTSEIDSLCQVLAMLKDYDYSSVILSVSAGCIDEGYSPSKPSEMINKLSEFLTPVIFQKSTPQKLSSWAVRHFEHGGVKIGASALSFFIEYCGTGMYKLANEIDKLCAFVLYEGRNEVTLDDIRNVCVTDMEFDAFALANAIMEGRNADALEVLDFLRFKRADPLMIFGDISKTFCDLLMIKRLIDDGMSPFDIGTAKIMNEFRAKIYARSVAKITYDRLYKKITLCTDADRQLKLSTQGYSPIEILICAD